MSGACSIIWKIGLHSYFSLSRSFLSGDSYGGSRRRNGLTMPGCPFSHRLHPNTENLFRKLPTPCYLPKLSIIVVQSMIYPLLLTLLMFLFREGRVTWSFVIAPCWSWSQSTCSSCLWCYFNRLFRKSIVMTPPQMSCSSIAWTTDDFLCLMHHHWCYLSDF